MINNDLLLLLVLHYLVCRAEFPIGHSADNHTVLHLQTTVYRSRCLSSVLSVSNRRPGFSAPDLGVAPPLVSGGDQSSDSLTSRGHHQICG